MTALMLDALPPKSKAWTYLCAVAKKNPNRTYSILLKDYYCACHNELMVLDADAAHPSWFGQP
jgi:hypothetical protein